MKHDRFNTNSTVDDLSPMTVFTDDIFKSVRLSTQYRFIQDIKNIGWNARWHGVWYKYYQLAYACSHIVFGKNEHIGAYNGIIFYERPPHSAHVHIIFLVHLCLPSLIVLQKNANREPGIWLSYPRIIWLSKVCFKFKLKFKVFHFWAVESMRVCNNKIHQLHQNWWCCWLT